MCFLIITSCNKDQNEEPQIDASIPCNLAIDESIRFDTIWITQLSSDYLQHHFTDKYIILERKNDGSPERFFDVFSIISGELITTIEPSQNPDFENMNFSFFGDFLHYSVSLNTRLYSYNFITGELQFHDKPFHFVGLVHDFDHYYAVENTRIAEYDYNGNLTRELPALGAWPDIKVRDAKSVFYKGLDVLNRKILAYIYSERNEKDSKLITSAITIVDLNSGKIENQFKFPHTTVFYYFAENSDMLLARASNFIFAYDLKSKKYYFRGISDYNTEVYAFQPFVSQNGNVESMVFFNNPSLSAEGFDTGKLMWECDKIGGSKMRLIYLTRQNGDIDYYLGFIGGYGKLYLAEIGTGVIKAAYDIENLPFYSYKDLRIIDEKGVFIQITSNDLLKVKISVQ